MKTVFTQILVAAGVVFLASGLQNVRADGFGDDDEEEVAVVVPDVGQSSDDSIDAVRQRVAEKKNALRKEFQKQQEVILNEAQKAIKAEKPVEWTFSDTEWFWNRIVDSSTKTSTKPRIPQADEEGGEGLLETFGTQYLPNAYAYYQEVRATAKEREQVLSENFPDGRVSDATGGTLYDKVQKATAKAVAEMFRRHDELCHYLLLHRMGAVSDQKLADRDASRIAIVLPEEADPPAVYDRSAPVLAPSEIDFATKYLPETRAAFQRLDNAFAEGVKTYGEWRKTALLIDATRSDALFQSLRDRLDSIHVQMDGIVRMVKEKKLLHAVGETSAAALADTDRDRGLSIQQFEKGLAVGDVVGNHVRMAVKQLKAPRLTEYQRDRDNRIAGIREKARRDVEALRRKFNGEIEHFDHVLTTAELKNKQPAICVEILASMVDIPGKNYKMSKFEVTQNQWEAIMGYNSSSKGYIPSSSFKNPNNPAINVSWIECQKFLTKLNSHPTIIQSGLTFRLPTEKEWMFACLADENSQGSERGWGSLADGSTIKKNTLKQVAWFETNSSQTIHPVGQKLPNAFGLYDMIGNVEEWTQKGTRQPARTYERFSCMGGSYCNLLDSGEVKWLARYEYNDHDRCDLGFRLCATKKVQLGDAAATNTAVKNILTSMVDIPGKNFKMCKFEVTQGQWKAIMGENPAYQKEEDCPVECVSWDDCQTFISLLNTVPAVQQSGLTFRLPTTEEWEYACRAGGTGDYCRLADGTEITSSTLDRVAWFKDNSRRRNMISQYNRTRTHPVGQKEPNAFGLHDMIGNVREWTATAWTAGLWGRDENSPRIVFGGSFDTSNFYEEIPDPDHSPGFCDPSYSDKKLGFRLCAEKNHP